MHVETVAKTVKENKFSSIKAVEQMQPVFEASQTEFPKMKIDQTFQLALC